MRRPTITRVTAVTAISGVAMAALVAPFEYLALPLSILLGMLIFDEWPDVVAWVGIALILGSGLFTVWRENQLSKQQSPKRQG